MLLIKLKTAAALVLLATAVVASGALSGAQVEGGDPGTGRVATPSTGGPNTPPKAGPRGEPGPQGHADKGRAGEGQEKETERKPAPAPLDLLLKASRDVRNLRSAHGTAVFEAYELGRDEKEEPHTKGKVSVYFDGGKYHLRYTYDYRQRRTVPAKVGGGEDFTSMTPDDVAVIYDGAATREVVYSAHWFRPAGCVVNLRDRLRDASWGVGFDHPAELWREALDVEALVKDLGREALTLTQLDDGTIHGSYLLKNAARVRAEFEARPADGYNVSSVRVFNEGEARPAQTSKATWSRTKDVWHVKELVTELDSRGPAGTGKLYRVVFRYESFEPSAQVDPKLFTLDCLAITPGAHTLDQRSVGPR
jgi:hypothetical protein